MGHWQHSLLKKKINEFLHMARILRANFNVEVKLNSRKDMTGTKVQKFHLQIRAYETNIGLASGRRQMIG